jgi:hypothetical protein
MGLTLFDGGQARRGSATAYMALGGNRNAG